MKQGLFNADGTHPDGRITPQLEVGNVTLNAVAAFQTPDGEAIVMYDRGSMQVRYQKILDTLYQVDPRKADILDKTMNGEFLEEDFQNLSRATSFLLSQLEAHHRGEYEYDRDFVRDTLYQYKERFFPNAMQLLSDAGMSEAVSGQHKNRDPLLHTCEAMANIILAHIKNPTLDTETIALEIVAITLHDFGKLHNPKDASHASGSVVWSQKWIDGIAAKMSEIHLVTNANRYIRPPRYTAEEAKFVLNFLIQYHDLGGFIDSKKISKEQAFELMLSGEFVPNTQTMLSLKRVQDADMAAIPDMDPRFIKGNREALDDLLQRLVMLRFDKGYPEDLFLIEQLGELSQDDMDKLFGTIARAETADFPLHT
ncbi:MAG: hypothetical protein H6773_03020 [Pseudomonadales bacterium]|nr:hypothetical protein [Pseudomonadales bacterium]